MEIFLRCFSHFCLPFHDREIQGNNRSSRFFCILVYTFCNFFITFVHNNRELCFITETSKIILDDFLGEIAIPWKAFSIV